MLHKVLLFFHDMCMVNTAEKNKTYCSGKMYWKCALHDTCMQLTKYDWSVAFEKADF